MLDSMGTVSCAAKRNSGIENRCVRQRRLLHYRLGRMTYNSQNKRTSIENLAGQVTTTAWDCCFAYGYNEKSELTNAVAAVDAAYCYSYNFDDIGNSKTSSERGTNSVYTAIQLNQYTAVDDFTPTYDADGNETLVKTATGIWSVTYNSENRPILWENISTNSSTHNPTTPTLISMSYDRMGRRVTKNAQRFIYDGYLQIANFELQTSNIKLQTFIWDPTEPVATRPLVWTNHQSPTTNFYTHDGNKNVSEVVAKNGDIVAHYEYAPFGDLILQYGISAAVNPWCFSSEYAENDTAMLCYNYRHCDIHLGRWINPDPICVPMYDCKNKRWTGIDIYGSDMKALYYFLENPPCNAFDYLGLRITEQECEALINRLWFFNYESGLDVDVFGMKVEIESGLGCENPMPKCVCTIEHKSGSYNGYDNSIEINYYYVTKSSVRGTLLHELQHRLDWCRLGPIVDCSDRAEREVWAVLRSGRCAKFYDGKTLIDWDCVKKTAKQSTERHKECRSIAENVVNQAVERVTGGNL